MPLLRRRLDMDLPVYADNAGLSRRDAEECPHLGVLQAHLQVIDLRSWSIAIQCKAVNAQTLALSTCFNALYAVQTALPPHSADLCV